jgi:hypothetical protein
VLFLDPDRRLAIFSWWYFLWTLAFSTLFRFGHVLALCRLLLHLEEDSLVYNRPIDLAGWALSYVSSGRWCSNGVLDINLSYELACSTMRASMDATWAFHRRTGCARRIPFIS